MFVTTVEARQTMPAGAFAALAARLTLHVERFAEPRHLWAQPLANQRTRERIANLLRALGYSVVIQGKYRNVIGVPPRWRAQEQSPPLPAVCAHYDSVPTTPGADDNGSALAVMLEVAAAAAAADVPIVVIAFNAEEDDLAGSCDFAASYRGGAAPRLSVAHVLEMVGFTSMTQRLPEVPRWLSRRVPTAGDFIAVGANRHSIRYLKQVLVQARRSPLAPPVVGLRAYLGAERWLPDLLRSDHAPLWEAGIPALLWTDTAEFRNPHYHRPTDTPDTLDYTFMARVTMLLLRSLEIPVL